MDHENVQALLKVLGKHPNAQGIDSSQFVSFLDGLSVKGSRRFYQELPDVCEASQLVGGEGEYSELKLTHVLRTQNARDYVRSPFKKATGAAISPFVNYAPVTLTRKLRLNEKVVETMAKSPFDYAVLGRHQFYINTDAVGGPTLVLTRPIVLIGGVNISQEVLDFEKANTTRARVVSLLGMIDINVRITEGMYRKLS